MKTTGIQLLKKLHVLLAAWLCCLLVIAIPARLQATPTAAADLQRELAQADDAPLLLVVGEVTFGEAEAVLLLNKSFLTPLFYSLLHHFYPYTQSTLPALSPCPASKDDRGLHTILTKGP